jgi:hypothetical protein
MATLDSDIQVNAALPAARRNLLLAVHILATVGLFGADLVLLLLGASSVFGADPRSVYPAAHLIGQMLVQPLALVSLSTGVALALLTPWGLFQYWWTALKLAITVALTIVVLVVLVPRLGAAADAAASPAPQAMTTTERVPLMLAPALGSSLLALNVALAVYKPRWRLRGAPAAARRTQHEFA